MDKPFRVVDRSGSARFSANTQEKMVKKAARLNGSKQPEVVARQPFHAERRLRNGTWEAVRT